MTVPQLRAYDEYNIRRTSFKITPDFRKKLSCSYVSTIISALHTVSSNAFFQFRIQLHTVPKVSKSPRLSRLNVDQGRTGTWNLPLPSIAHRLRLIKVVWRHSVTLLPFIWKMYIPWWLLRNLWQKLFRFASWRPLETCRHNLSAGKNLRATRTDTIGTNEDEGLRIQVV